MSEIFHEAVEIIGSADDIQLTVQGASGQSLPLQSWENASADELARISADGRFQNGDMSLSTADALIEAHRDSGSSLPKRGFHSLGRIASALAEAVSWLVAELELLGTGTISGLHRALRVKLSHSSSGDSSAAELRAGDFEIINQSGSSEDPLGKVLGIQATVDNQTEACLNQAIGISSRIQNGTDGEIAIAKAFEVQAPLNDATIDLLIGLDIADLNEGSDNYAIRTGAGKVQLGDLNAGLLKADSAGLLSNAVKGIDFDTPMEGASSSTDGVAGIVPQPLEGDENKFLRGDGTWANASVVAALNDLTDVDTTGAAADEVLTFNGTNWVPQSVNIPEMQGATSSADGVAGIVPQPLEGDEDKFLRGDGTWADGGTVAALNDLSDVDTAGAGNGSGLHYDGTLWKTLKHNLVATDDPTAADGSAEGYDLNSLWLNTLNGAVWICSAVDTPHPDPIIEYARENQDTAVQLRGQVPASYTADQCSGGTASASSSATSRPASNAFANNGNALANSWVTDSTVTGWLKYDFGSGVTKLIRRYTLIHQDTQADRAPKDWTLEGSNDNSNWTILDGQSNQTGWTGIRTFDFYNATAYRYYRINVLANNGGGSVAIGEMEMMEAASYGTANDKLTQIITLGATNEIIGLVLELRKLGAPSGTLSCRLETVDGSNNPTGTLAHASASISLSEANLKSFLAEELVLFPSQFSLVAGSYAIVLSSDRSTSQVNYIEWAADGSSPSYTGGEMKSAVSTSWSSESKDAIFQLLAPGASWALLSPGSEGTAYADPSQYRWANLNTAVGSFEVDKVNKRLSLQGDGSGSLNLRGFYIPIPHAAPYSVRIQMKGIFPNVTNNGYMLFFRESLTGKLVTCGLRYNAGKTLVVSKFNSPTSLNANYLSEAQEQLEHCSWFKLEDDGSDRKFSISPDGENWTLVHTIGRTDFLTTGADQLGIALWLTGSGPFETSATLLSWEVLQ